jgi:hypothetical protein
MKDMKTIALGDLFTEAQFREAEAIVKSSTSPHGALVQWIEPLMPQINERTNQENDPHFFAYAVEYALTQRKGA